MTDMRPTTVLFCGHGYTSAALKRHLSKQPGWSFVATTRDAGKADTLRADAITPIVWGETAPLDLSALSAIDAVLISAAPEGETCSVLHRLEDALAARARDIRWIGYLSSNGVYGDHDGGWVTEDSNLKPVARRARARVRAEADWASFAAAYSLPLVIFRLPGIYGPGRSAIDSVRTGSAKRIVKNGQVFSRAHVDDIARVLHASMEQPAAGDLFNVADDEPAPPQDVITYTCEIMGVEPPPLIPFDDADMSEMARSFYADNKRVSNDRMKERLSVTLQYPTYREGLDAILAHSKDMAS